MRIVKLTPESKNNILENLLKRSPNSYGKFEAAVNDILQMYAPEKMKRYLSIQRISIRQTSMQKMSV